jgi:hypothetical protein
VSAVSQVSCFESREFESLRVQSVNRDRIDQTDELMKSGMLQAEPIVVQAHVVNAVNVDGGFNPSAPPPPPFSNPSLPRFENEGGAREFLMQHHFPLGLQDAFIESQ